MDTHITFHGTSEENLLSILKNGFSCNFGKGYGSAFGKGIYSTPCIKYASCYTETNKLLVCEIQSSLTLKLLKKEVLHRKNKNIKYDLLIIDDCDEYLCSKTHNIKPIGILIVNKKWDGDTLIDVEVVEKRLLGDQFSLENILL